MQRRGYLVSEWKWFNSNFGFFCYRLLLVCIYTLSYFWQGCDLFALGRDLPNSASMNTLFHIIYWYCSASICSVISEYGVMDPSNAWECPSTRAIGRMWLTQLFPYPRKWPKWPRDDKLHSSWPNQRRSWPRSSKASYKATPGSRSTHSSWPTEMN